MSRCAVLGNQSSLCEGLPIHFSWLYPFKIVTLQSCLPEKLWVPCQSSLVGVLAIGFVSGHVAVRLWGFVELRNQRLPYTGWIPLLFLVWSFSHLATGFGALPAFTFFLRAWGIPIISE